MFRKPSLRTRLLLGAVLFAVPAAAHANDVTGNVSEASGTRNLQGARVTIVELGRTTEADSSGSFRFGDVPAGTYTLRAEFAGVPASEAKIVVPESGVVAQDLVLGTEGSQILVVGQRANLLGSLSRQRAADGVESVLTRDSVGQFPDQNVAESLRRLPGINILNDQGEGRFVSVRGLDPELNGTSVNGTRLPAPESDVRSVALDVISSDTIESIEVKKSLTPDMDADTIGASIEINTVSAFARKKDLLTASIEGSYNELRETVTPKVGFDFSKRITDNFGIAGGVSYYQRKFATNNEEMDGWDEDGGTVYADTMEYRDYDVERKRFSSSLSLDWKPSDTTTLYARGLYSRFDDQEYRRRLTFEMDEAPTSGTATTATFDSQDGEITVTRDLKDRFERQEIKSLTLGGETKSNGWKLTYSGSWARSSERENGSIDPAAFERKFDDGDNFIVAFDYSDPKKTGYNILAGSSVFNNASEYEFDKLERTTLSDSVDTEWAARADLAKTFATGSGEFTVAGGAKFRWRTKRYNADIDVYEYDGPGDLTLANLTGVQDYDLAYIQPVPSKTGFRNYFNSNTGLFELDDGDTFESSNDSDYKVKEDVSAGYLLARWDSAKFRVIGGVRMEHTYNDIQGQELDLDAETVTPIRATRNYTDWLPSLTARFEPANGLVLRAAGYRSLVRPKFSKLAPRVVIEDDEGEFGNPNLQPYKAWNFDASAEYYFGKGGGITLGYFHKDIKNYIVDRVYEDYAYNGRVLDEAQVPYNGPSARINGIEFSYSQLYTFLPGALSGLLTQINYTYTDAKGTVLEDGDIGDPRVIPLPSSAKNTFNVVLGYEKGPISFRVAGTYRDRYLDELGDDASEDRYVDDHFQLDISAKYWLTKNIQVYGDLINLTNAPYYAYRNFEGGTRLLQYEDYSFTGKFGVKIKF
ncbi:TonB-dependent receptor [Sphingomonas sp. HITSZ_GF]|uniref:TonB-dependent receptor n=1 Tax=Sphingomonas sp. HITSZ_GF TaxID=3037247 RepID=UPI00240E5865|nr:TonB-dependent receptor [Sphingomonas sp. HITSZ_GF]MDG2533935.1 TonB-dependent receptor [Sphingomonas sp. HITSZ_GF]